MDACLPLLRAQETVHILELCPSLVQRKRRLPAFSNLFFSINGTVATQSFVSCRDDLQTRQVFPSFRYRNAAVFDDADSLIIGKLERALPSLLVANVRSLLSTSILRKRSSGANDSC